MWMLSIAEVADQVHLRVQNNNNRIPFPEFYIGQNSTVKPDGDNWLEMTFIKNNIWYSMWNKGLSLAGIMSPFWKTMMDAGGER